MRKYTDQCLLDINGLTKKVLEEHFRQIDKWGIQTCTPFEWLVYTMEELGEVAEAIGEHEYRDGTVEQISIKNCRNV